VGACGGGGSGEGRENWGAGGTGDDKRSKKTNRKKRKCDVAQITSASRRHGTMAAHRSTCATGFAVWTSVIFSEARKPRQIDFDRRTGARTRGGERSGLAAVALMARVCAITREPFRRANALIESRCIMIITFGTVTPGTHSLLINRHCCFSPLPFGGTIFREPASVLIRALACIA